MPEASRLRIACLAWGSLVWKRGPLLLRTGWAGDGPRLPIEFVRVGELGELATTLWAPAARVPTRWALLEATGLDDAREMLRRREQIPPEHPDRIGVALPSGPPTSGASPYADEIATWAAARQLDAVVWTALPPRYRGEEGRAPTVDEAVDYLDGLRGQTREHAHRYIRQVSAEIRTPYRARFEARLGLTPRS